MSLVHGRDIGAEELERIVGREFSVQRFASLCNAITWATTKPPGSSQIAFSERVLVRDNGVDAEWVLDLPAALEHLDLVGPGRNVFQYKQRDVTARERNRIVSDLTGELRGAANGVAARTGQALQRYLLFTNVSLTLEQKKGLDEAIREDCEDEPVVRVLGAAELVSALNNLPHLRSSFFATAQFAVWSQAWDSHKRASITGGAPALVGRQSSVDGVKAAVDDDSIRAVLIAGVPDIGKSRVALAATEHRQIDTVFALDAVSLKITDLLALKSVNQPIVAVIEDPDLDRVNELVTTALGEDFKIVLTIPSSRAVGMVNYGRDPRVKLFQIEALSDTESQEMLRSLGAKFDWSMQSWVIEQAGGNPGILLAASSIGQRLRIEGPAFRDQVGNELEERARILTGDTGIETLRLLSIMTAVGFRGPAEGELQTLCRVLGGITSNQAINAVKVLSQAGFLRIRGSYLEVAPPILANYFAEAALLGRPGELAQLFGELVAPARIRLLRRVRQVRANAVDAFWSELFERGPLSTFESALAEILLVRLVTPAVPDRVAPLLLGGLQAQTVRQRTAIEGSARRELVWTLDQLLFRRASSAAALRSLSLLAEAENESWGNNSANVFSECFHPLHPQLPLPLEDRVAILHELIAPPSTRERQLLVTEAIGAAFSSHGAVILRRSEGPEPFDEIPALTSEQIHNYFQELIRMLRDLLNGNDAQVALTAGEALTAGIEPLARLGRPGEALNLLEEIRPGILDESVPIRLESFVHAIQLTIRLLESQGDRFREEAARAVRLLQAIDQGGYEIRVKRWTSSWELGDKEVDDEGKEAFRFEREIQTLAREAADHPDVLVGQLLNWLLSTEAKRAHIIFYWLGRYDTQARWQARIEDLGKELNGHTAFSSYFGGRAAVDRVAVEARLNQLSVVGLVRGEAIVAATGHIPANPDGVRRVIQLLAQQRVNPIFAEKQLMSGGWMNTLTGQEAFELLSAIAGPDLERAEPVVDFLAMWIHSQKRIEGNLGELAWRALEIAPKSGEAWDYDIVASTLLPDNFERAFMLLERLLTLPHDQKRWEPLDRHGGNRFWNALWAADRDRCLRALFSAGLQSPLVKWQISWQLPDVLDLQRDRDILIDFAQQNIESAIFISSIITAARPGFWPIAIAILSAFPESQEIRGNVGHAAEHMNHVITGPSSVHYDQCAGDVELAIESEHATGRALEVLKELAHRLRQWAKVERRQEADEEVNL